MRFQHFLTNQLFYITYVVTIQFLDHLDSATDYLKAAFAIDQWAITGIER
jgi:hypothetical protein